MLQAGHCRELGASIYELAHVANLAQDGSSGLASSSHTYFFCFVGFHCVRWQRDGAV